MMDISCNKGTSKLFINAFLQHPAAMSSGSSFLLGRHLLLSWYGPKSGKKQSVIALQTDLREARHFGQSRGLREGSNEQSLPEEDSDNDHEFSAPLADGEVLKNGEAITELDWRAFRASLVASENEAQEGKELKSHGSTDASSVRGVTGTLGKSWAHPLYVPEAGCVLVATDKLDGQIDFERTVILLLRVGSNKPREGPFGVIINRPMSQTIDEFEPDNRALTNVFGDCPCFYGGPLESELFLLMQERKPHKQFAEIIPGVSHIGLNGLQHAAQLLNNGAVSINDFRFYVGYAGWGFDQLKNEIASGYWHVAACSTTLLRATSSDRLWQNVLRLMGGRYAALSKKPRKGGFQ